MEISVIIILLLSLLLLGLQFTFFSKKWVTFAYLLLIAVGVYMTHTLAIEESYQTIRQIMNNPKAIGNFSALVIAEALLGILFSIVQIKILCGEKVKKWKQYMVYFVGIVPFIAIYYAETLLFLTIRGIHFTLFAIMLTIIIPLALWSLKVMLKKIVPEYDLRAEMKFFMHLMQIILAIALSVLVLKLPISTPQEGLPIKETALVLCIILAFATIGTIIYKIKLKKIWKS